MTIPSPLPGGTRWLVLCRVIDNYGDAGVCWRLARQLAREHDARVTLLINRPELIERLAGPAGKRCGVEVRRWPANGGPILTPGTVLDAAPWVSLASSARDVALDPRLSASAAASGARTSPANDRSFDVIVSAFGCEPPPAVRAALAGAPVHPLWIDLEYLSAETWIEACHGLASVKPADGAVQYLFCPGFTSASGGLLRERDALARIDSIEGERAAVLQQLRGLTAHPGERLVTLFCYAQAPVTAWLGALASAASATLVVVPEGVAVQAVERFAGAPLATGDPPLRRGSLRLARIPFVTQDDYDRLLRVADLNFVRGEDSWIRAHWAQRPFVWQPYPQDGSTHIVKLNAFLERMRSAILCAEATGATAATAATEATGSIEAIEAMMRAWSGDGDPIAAWHALEKRRTEVARAFRRWTDSLLIQRDFALNLARWVSDALQ